MGVSTTPVHRRHGVFVAAVVLTITKEYQSWRPQLPPSKRSLKVSGESQFPSVLESPDFTVHRGARLNSDTFSNPVSNPVKAP